MIIMPVKEGENIERALKKFKRKYERTGVLKELRRRQYFTKPSVAKREAMQHAIYVEHMYREEEYFPQPFGRKGVDVASAPFSLEHAGARANSQELAGACRSLQESVYPRGNSRTQKNTGRPM